MLFLPAHPRTRSLNLPSFEPKLRRDYQDASNVDPDQPQEGREGVCAEGWLAPVRNSVYTMLP